MSSRILAIATGVAIAALPIVPTTEAAVNARTFWDIAVGLDFRDGAGLYDPTGPWYCVALTEVYFGLLPARVYHNPPTRYFPGLAASVHHDTQFFSPALPSPLGDCLTLDPPVHTLNVDMAQADAGSAVWIDVQLANVAVAQLGSVQVEFQYCSAPVSANPTPAWAVDQSGARAFGAAYVLCPPGFYGSYELYGPARNCDLFTMSTSGGSLTGDQPVFLTDGGSCNTLVGSGQSLALLTTESRNGVAALLLTGSDYVAQMCVSVDVVDTVTGLVAAEAQDSDFFTVFHDGSLAPWSTTAGTPQDMFPNVANLEWDRPAPTC